MDKNKINSMGIPLTTAQWTAIDQYITKQQELSLCPNCHCMTKNVCGKCKELKQEKE